jgi:hypothetical protein
LSLLHKTRKVINIFSGKRRGLNLVAMDGSLGAAPKFRPTRVKIKQQHFKNNCQIARNIEPKPFITLDVNNHTYYKSKNIGTVKIEKNSMYLCC